MFHRTARVLEHVPLAERTFRVRLECPELASAIRPGQFVMMRLPNTTDPLLGRPFALYDTVLDAAGSPIGIDIVYLVVGKMTGKLAALVRPDERNADPPPLPQALLGERWESKSRRATSIPASGVRAASSPVVESACDVSMPTSPQSRGKD